MKIEHRQQLEDRFDQINAALSDTVTQRLPEGHPDNKNWGSDVRNLATALGIVTDKLHRNS